MVRRLTLVAGFLIAGLVIPHAARAEDAPDKPFDPTIDECAAPDAHCLPESPDPTDAELDAKEIASPEDLAPSTWLAAPAQVACPEGSSVAADGQCVPNATAVATVEGGCNAGKTSGALTALVIAALLGFVIARRRRALLLIIAACSFDGGSYDDAVNDGATGDTTTYLDVYSVDLGDSDGVQFMLANQTAPTGAPDPVAQFSLERDHGALPIFRQPGTCGDRLVTATAPNAELLGWARDGAGDGTAELIELASPGGCYQYEIDQETIDNLVAQGFKITGTVGYVWPPGLADPAPPTDDPADPTATPLTTGPTPCPKVTKHSALELLYASPGKDETLRFLLGCGGEVVVGEKRELGPVGSMKSAAAHAAGGRTAFVVDRNGDKLRELLMRSNGVERTVAYMKKKLAEGYDYIVLDEITMAPDFRDSQTLNRRLRALLLRMPARTIIPYISIDLTQQSAGFGGMQARKYLLRSFKRRARVLALEVYLHTGQVRAGAAPLNFRRAADRLALSVRGLAGAGGINQNAISTIGTSMHSGYSQYNYLDQASYDLTSLSRQVNAIRHGSKRLRQQHGVGWYFVNKSDMAPPSSYSYDALIRRMRLLGLRFK